jgi:uncharacterized membrane protein YGL010W
VKTLEDQMSFYAAYHQDARNKATHFVGVPMIILALFIPLAWLRIDIGGATITGAMVFAAVVIVYYFLLDIPLALVTGAITILLLILADWIARQGYAIGGAAFGLLFVGGWIFQLVGHVFEGRKPAFADNLFQIFVSPIALCAEAFFVLGLKRGLHDAVKARAVKMRVAAAQNGTRAA